MTNLIALRSAQCRAQSMVLEGCRGRAAELNDAIDGATRLLKLCRFMDRDNLKDAFGCLIDAFDNEKGQIGDDLDREEKLSRDDVTIDLSELREAFARAVR